MSGRAWIALVAGFIMGWANRAEAASAAPDILLVGRARERIAERLTQELRALWLQVLVVSELPTNPPPQVVAAVSVTPAKLTVWTIKEHRWNQHSSFAVNDDAEVVALRAAEHVRAALQPFLQRREEAHAVPSPDAPTAPPAQPEIDEKGGAPATPVSGKRLKTSDDTGRSPLPEAEKKRRARRETAAPQWIEPLTVNEFEVGVGPSLVAAAPLGSPQWGAFLSARWRAHRRLSVRMNGHIPLGPSTETLPEGALRLSLFQVGLEVAVPVEFAKEWTLLPGLGLAALRIDTTGAAEPPYRSRSAGAWSPLPTLSCELQWQPSSWGQLFLRAEGGWATAELELLVANRPLGTLSAPQGSIALGFAYGFSARGQRALSADRGSSRNGRGQ